VEEIDQNCLLIKQIMAKKNEAKQAKFVFTKSVTKGLLAAEIKDIK
jgi:hypothetical protein